VRNGTALETLGKATVVVFDKTGTITIGRPEVERVLASPPYDQREVLRLASGVEQGSSHLLARTLVERAQRDGITVPAGRNIIEAAGRGVSGVVDGLTVLVGSRGFVMGVYPQLAELDQLLNEPAGTDGVRLLAFVVVDGKLAGAVQYADALRTDAAALVQRLKKMGVARVVLLSGDHPRNVRAVANEVGIAEFEGDLLPQDKVDRIRAFVSTGAVVLMAGDGTNDAPALSSASVGVALAGHGGGITAEAADVVLTKDELSRVGEAMQISRRTLREEPRSVWPARAWRLFRAWYTSSTAVSKWRCRPRR
jgi:P-type E1-E2 ATPase